MYANEDSNICQYLDLVYPILKFTSLPILYNTLYKISKNKIILGFIHLLKTNILFKIFILFLTLIPEYLFFISSSKSTSIFAYVCIYILVSSVAIFFCFSGGKLKNGGREIVINGMGLKKLKIQKYI